MQQAGAGSLIRATLRLAAAAVAAAVAATAGAAPAAAAVGQWTSIGPDGAWVNALAVEPANPAVLYAAVQVSGVFKSENGGDSWFAANQGLPELDLPFGGVYALAIDPFAPAVVYAATARGIYKTTDAGGRWSSTGPDVGAGSLACDPAVPGTVYAAGANTVWVSRDGGARWEISESLPRAVDAQWVVADPGDGRVYALGRRFDAVFRLHVSADHGRSWHDLSAALPYPPLLDGPRIDQGQLAIDPGPSGALYLAYPGVDYHRIPPTTYQSTDRGHSWHAVGPGGFPIAVGPHHAIYAGGVRSLDSGRTWTPMGATPEPVITLAAAGSAVYAGGQTLGVLRSADGGGSWRISSAGLRADDIGAFALDPTNPARIFAFAPTADGGGALVASADGGRRWRGAPAIGLCIPPGACAVGVLAQQALILAVDPLAPATVYLASREGLQRSTDGGHLVYPLFRPGVGCLGIDVLALDPFVSGTLYGTGGYSSSPCSPGTPDLCRAFKSTDGGETWGCLDLDATLVAVAPRSPGRLYAIGFDAARNQALYTSSDRGDTWAPVGGMLPQDDDFGVLLVDPVDSSRLYAGGTFSGGVWRSLDAGKSWRQVLAAGHGPTFLAIDPIAPRNLYMASSDIGVLHSADRGLSWQPLVKGLPAFGYLYNQLATDPRRSGTVYLATVTNAVLAYTLP